jgi:hypothetical protein
VSIEGTRAHETETLTAPATTGVSGAASPPGLLDLGTERFVLRRKLGAGAFGAVFEALDRERNAVVALKTLERHDPRALYGFKREFRALTEIVHPNLVQLYELHGAGERWFFTMELVPGCDALDALCSTAPEGSSATSSDRRDDSTVLAPSDMNAPGPPIEVRVNPGRTLDARRVRAAFRQLAEGLCFLHAAGRIHRDIKPTNVRITPEGRAVILDFGLVIELAGETAQSMDQIAGTPLYMAPEQAVPGPVGPPADWYALGAMLYEVLTGRPPFTGSLTAVLRAKWTEDPRPPAEILPELPEDLCRLAMDLLAREPARRPLGGEILERLGPTALIAPEAPATVNNDATLIGRTVELAALRAAFASAKEGRAVVALVHGRSGMGKSTLTERFLDDLRADERGVMVLAGRCFEQESVPYKALDGVIDALSRRLRRLSSDEVEAIIPRDAAVLARLFPVLLQSQAFEARVDVAARRAGALGDPIELRRRAFGALREMFGRIGDRRPLVLFIDDLQWGDVDSAALLIDLLRPPDAPPLLLVATYRTDEAERSACLATLLPALEDASKKGIERREISVGQLSEGEAEALALAELAGKGTSARAARIAREAGGWPFFVRELAHYAGALEDAAPPSLEEMILGRVAALPDDARRLLEVLAIAAQPLERAVAAKAAEVEGGEPACVAVLRRQRLLRVRGRAGSEEIETYHDRIHETVAGALSAELRRKRHERLGAALEVTGKADAEVLATHFHAAGQREKAAQYAVQAADGATAAFGFDQAVRLYRQAIALMNADDPERRALHERLGEALSSAGRGVEAAAAYLVAAEGQAPATSLVLRRKAAENQIMSGHTDEGLEAMRPLLAAVGITLPITRLGALLRTLPLMLWFWLRGLRYRERSAEEIPAKELLRLDACAAIAADFIRQPHFHSLYAHQLFLWHALRAGEPRRICMALSGELIVRTYFRIAPSELTIHRMAVGLVDRFSEEKPRLEMSLGFASLFRWRLRDARAYYERAESMLAVEAASARHDGMVGAVRKHIDLGFVRVQLVGLLQILGTWNDLRRRYPVWLEDARARGDIYVERRLLCEAGRILALCADRPEEARDLLSRGEALWPDRDGFNKQVVSLWSRCHNAQYEESGVGTGALLIQREHPLRPKTWIPAAMQVMNLLSFADACVAAAATSSRGEREELLRAAERAVRRFRRRSSPGVLYIYLWKLDASVAATRGDRERALAMLLKAETICVECELGMVLEPLRRRRGELLGGEEGRALVEAADAAMRAEGIVNPARWAASFVPGRFGPPGA